MATLQKFKLFATQCGVAPSPTRSPSTSPLVQFPRRKTSLRMLLTRKSTLPSPSRRFFPVQEKPLLELPEEKGEDPDHQVRKQSLKELFVSSPTREEEDISEKIHTGEFIGGLGSWRDGLGPPRPVWNRFRCRSLLSKSWRPKLETIME